MKENRTLTKAAIVTGGTKGLGRSLSIAFGDAGYFVVSVYKSDSNAAHKLEQQFKSKDILGITLQHNILEAGLMEKLSKYPFLEKIEEYTLINNACSAFEPKPLHLVAPDELEANLLTAVKGAFQCIQSILPKMVKAKKGTIVNILSQVVQDVPPKGFSAYTPAKYALMGLTKAVASEYKSRGIRVFSFSPGFMETSLTENWEPHLKHALLGNLSQACDPNETAKEIFNLVSNLELPGNGENYFK